MSCQSILAYIRYACIGLWVKNQTIPPAPPHPTPRVSPTLHLPPLGCSPPHPPISRFPDLWPCTASENQCCVGHKWAETMGDGEGTYQVEVHANKSIIEREREERGRRRRVVHKPGNLGCAESGLSGVGMWWE